MREVIKKTSFAKRAGELADSVIGILSPKKAYQRHCFRSAYEVLDRHRTRTKRKTSGGTGDVNLNEASLGELREIGRDLSRNNPIAKGLLQTEADEIIGEDGPKIECRSKDEKWNEEAEAAFDETAVNVPIDITGRFNYPRIMQIGFKSYRRDGDAAVIFLDDDLQMVEGEQIGTPYGKSTPEFFDIVNGVAYSKATKKLMGYYIGQPDKWGYIRQDSWKNYPADKVFHIFNPDRVSYSRGEPVLTQSIKYIDYLTGIIDATMVAMKVNACFSMFISQTVTEIPESYPGGISTSGLDEDNNRLEKMEPGTILRGKPGESAVGIGQAYPGTTFDPFVARILSIIGRPLCLPMMLVTGDFSGATFMNARIAYQSAQKRWRTEQKAVVQPLAARIWRWKIGQLITSGRLKNAPDDWNNIEIFCNRWPYIDPYKEASADEQQIKNGTTTRSIICARQGLDFGEVNAQLAKEETLRKELGLTGKDDNKKTMEDITKGVRAGVPIGVKEARAVLGLPETPADDKLLRFNDQDVLQYHIENGLLTINEARKVLGLPAVSWGNTPVRKTTVEPVVEKEEKEEKEDEEEK